MTLAQKMAREGQTVEAIVQYEKARQNDPGLSGTVAWRLGILYDLGGDPARALVKFQEALKEFPKDPDLLTDIGYCHYNRGEWAQAEKYLRQALARAKKHQRAHMNLAMALCQQGKIEESLAEFTTVVSKAEAQANVGFLLLTQRRPEEAKQAFLKALELEPHLEKPRKALAKMEANRAGAPDQRGGEQRSLLPAPGS
jgi:Tfp pilus assembly protein PilF